MSEGPWTPVRVVDYDLLTGSASWDDGVAGGRVVALLRAHTRALGVTSVELGVSQTIGDQHQYLSSLYPEKLQRHLHTFGCSPTDTEPEDGVPACLARRRALLNEAPSVSVVVATHDRPALLARTLDSLLVQEQPALEVVVVDNARSSDATEQLVRSDRYASRGVRYVRENIPGLGRAHNAGLASARGEVIAITDDDVIVDSQWIAALLEAFVENEAGCVTGLILPVELRTREQAWVEQYGGFARGFERREFSLASPPRDDPLFPFTAGRFGSGANMAFTRELLDSMGGFDPALGAGTKAKGGDDLAAFARTLLGGGTLVYEPDAVVRHSHHHTFAALKGMAHGYGVGLGAYVTSLLWTQPELVREMIRRLPAGVRHLTRKDSDKNRNMQSDYPRELVVTERLGLLRGPFSYIASRRAESRRPGATRGRASRGQPPTFIRT